MEWREDVPATPHSAEMETCGLRAPWEKLDKSIGLRASPRDKRNPVHTTIAYYALRFNRKVLETLTEELLSNRESRDLLVRFLQCGVRTGQATRWSASMATRSGSLVRHSGMAKWQRG
jgi:hypothetical protein